MSTSHFSALNIFQNKYLLKNKMGTKTHGSWNENEILKINNYVRYLSFWYR